VAQLPPRYQPTVPALQGGMSDVIICNDSDLERLVAIKFIRDLADRRSLFDEIKALQQIRSKHVVQIYDIFTQEEGTLIGIVEEYVDGVNLNGATDQFAGDAKAYLKFLYQVARGLEDIHAANVIHGDIKPDNIKIDSIGIVKIYGCGLAREAGVDDAIAGRVEFTKSVDVFAFGLLSWCVTQSGIPVYFRHIPPVFSSPLPSFKDAIPELPESVSILLDRTLLSDPAQRPTSAALRICLEQHLLLDSHKALLVHQKRPYFLDKDRRQVTLKHPNNTDFILIEYNGFEFIVSRVVGHVFINNTAVVPGVAIPRSCVIGLGHSSSPNRLFTSFDISNPEVVL
jgi:serine/threonine protein kinase